MLVNEIFASIQGESTYAGDRCVFIRLAGCNLRCSWCDTPYAQTDEGARELGVEEILREAGRHGCRLVEITGGEPLLQADTKKLAERLLEEGLTVLLETNGSVSLAGIDRRVVKFVIMDEADYEFAKKFLAGHIRDRTAKILFSPVTPALPPKTLAEWMLRDRVEARLQLQLQAYIWPGERGR